MRLALLVAFVLTACSTPPQAGQLGVDIFAVDTIPVRFTVTMSGTLQMRVSAEKSYMRPDKSVVFETPATLVVYKGAGTSLVSAVDTGQRLAVQPLGVSPDSIERMDAAVVAAAVQITHLKDAARLGIEVAKP